MIFKINSSLVKIIAFEGLDASYKETNADMLYHYIKDERLKELVAAGKVNVVKMAFPTYDHRSCYYISQYLHGRYKDDEDKLRNSVKAMARSGSKFMDDFKEHVLTNHLTLVCNFFFAEMYDWNATEVIEKPTIFILDRYFYSQMYYLTKLMYESYSIQELMEKAKLVHHIASGVYHLPPANIVFKMSNTVDNMIQTIKERKGDKDIYEEDLSYLRKVREMFESEVIAVCADTNVTVKTVSVAGKDRETIATNIKDCLRLYLDSFEKEVDNFYLEQEKKG